MTREEAIKLLVNATYSDEWQGNEDLTTAHNMAIKALEQESCEDAVSVIKSMPSVTPAQVPIFDKIKAEIRELATFDTVDVLVEVNRIIDKYKESEDKHISGKENNE